MQIPLFPLNTVLFPGMRLPLNIFEERYKLLLKRCLDETLPFGVVLIRKGQEAGGPAEPYDVGTTARILSVEETDDGRYLIAIEGDVRFRIDEQLHRYPYIQAKVSPLPYEAGPVDADLIDEVRELYREFGSAALAMTGQWVRHMEIPEEPEELVNFVGARLSSANPAKQRVLEATTMERQLELEREILRVEVAAMSERFRNQQTQRWWTLSATN
jgi:Lon protease-like protein